MNKKYLMIAAVFMFGLVGCDEGGDSAEAELKAQDAVSPIAVVKENVQSIEANVEKSADDSTVPASDVPAASGTTAKQAEAAEQVEAAKAAVVDATKATVNDATDNAKAATINAVGAVGKALTDAADKATVAAPAEAAAPAPEGTTTQ